MTNRSRRLGFRPRNIKNAELTRMLITAGQVTNHGDVLYVDSNGTLALGGTTPVAGVQNGQIVDGTTYKNKTTAEAGDWVWVWNDPNTVFVGEITTFAQTDVYTTRSGAAAYDVAGTTGVQYIDAAASTLNNCKILGLAAEETGKFSVAGANAKVEFVFNPLIHLRGPIA